MSTRRKNPAGSWIWFEIPADNVERARKFYKSLFGWKINKFPGGTDYWHIDTGGADASPDGGLLARMRPEQTITQYVAVLSVTRFIAKVKKLGGKVSVRAKRCPNPHNEGGELEIRQIFEAEEALK